MRPWCHNLANRYSSIEIENIRQNVDSKFYEILETTHENADGDVWSAELMESQSHPVTMCGVIAPASAIRQEPSPSLTAIAASSNS